MMQKCLSYATNVTLYTSLILPELFFSPNSCNFPGRILEKKSRSLNYYEFNALPPIYAWILLRTNAAALEVLEKKIGVFDLL